jgi:hypothetical protein
MPGKKSLEHGRSGGEEEEEERRCNGTKKKQNKTVNKYLVRSDLNVVNFRLGEDDGSGRVRMAFVRVIAKRARRNQRTEHARAGYEPS